MRKTKYLFAIISILCIFALTACGCNHEWVEATCTEPKICTKCNEIEGEALGHTESEWIVTREPSIIAYGLEEKMCSVCDEPLDERDVDKKSPEVIGSHFNFTDDEFIDWIEDRTYLEFTLFLTGEQNTTYAVKNTNTDETGILLLNHKKDDTDGNICLIAMHMFDNNLQSIVTVTYIGELIDSSFSSDTATEKLYYDETYTKSDMTSLMLELDDDMNYAVLTPSEYLADILG